MNVDDVDSKLAIVARQILVSKLALYQGLPAGYISDPVVGVLLTLYVHHVDNVKLTDIELFSIIHDAPHSITERWLAVLQQDGSVSRDRANASEEYIELTVQGHSVVRTTLIGAGEAEKRVRADIASSNTR